MYYSRVLETVHEIHNIIFQSDLLYLLLDLLLVTRLLSRKRSSEYEYSTILLSDV